MADKLNYKILYKQQQIINIILAIIFILSVVGLCAEIRSLYNQQDDNIVLPKDRYGVYLSIDGSKYAVAVLNTDDNVQKAITNSLLKYFNQTVRLQ